MAVQGDGAATGGQQGAGAGQTGAGGAFPPERVISGRDAVRRILIDRLEAAGLARGRGVTAAQHEALMLRLVEVLAYMAPDNLATLAECVLDNATGGRWPSELLIRQWAEGLQARPPEQARIVTSWLASVEGPRADAEGWLVELYRFLVRHRRPPTAYDRTLLQAEAREVARRREIVEGRIERGSAGDDDLLWHRAWMADRALARALVADGAARREAGQ